MKCLTVGVVILMVSVGVLCAQVAKVVQTVNIVQITDMQGVVGFEIMNREQFTKLEKEIKEEAAVFNAAVAESKKEWDAKPDNKMMFQSNRVKLRSISKQPQDYSDLTKAQKRKTQLEEREMEKKKEEMAKDSRKVRTKKPSAADEAKESARQKAIADTHALISKKMAEKLKRSVPTLGFPSTN